MSTHTENVIYNVYLSINDTLCFPQICTSLISAIVNAEFMLIQSV